ncbi:hypothetical protein F4819DRAFT_482834 [Hypoxylon fuscum]|nr:hypothetical protein F4819DRAFT_482834 [Hypoxylon fuscum]
MPFLVLVITVASLVSAQFSNPPRNRATWKVGEVQSIRFKTDFTTFSIAIWQQALEGGSATLGPIVFETTNDSASQFDWLVQEYDFDLASSNVFFFWMFEGAPSLQGNQSNPQMSSSFFNLTNGSTASSSSIIIPSTTSSALGYGTTSDSAISNLPGNIQQSSDTRDSGGLNIGAKVGLGISISIAGLALITCIGVYLRYSKMQQRQIAKTDDGNIGRAIQEDTRPKAEPAEMATIHSPRLAELG